MYAGILRLMMIIWLMVSPLNVVLNGSSEVVGAVAAPNKVLNPIDWHPSLRPLSAGVPQTITLQIMPGTLIAQSGATAVVTATVVDITGDLVSGVNLSGSISPETAGTLSAMSVTDDSGQSTGTWTAGTAVGLATMQVGDGVVSGTASADLTAGTLTTVTVSPSIATVTVGLTTTFSAAGSDAFGNPVAITPTWSTDGGSIDATGVFTASHAPANGKSVIATADTVTGTAVVNVIAGPLNSIAVKPNPVSVVAGTSQAFTADGFDKYGNGVPITPTWTTNGGSIDASSGLFTAQITATAGRLVTATYGASSSSALVSIIAGPLNQILVSPSAVTLTVATTQVFSASGYDQYGNVVPITPTWTTNGGSINPSSGFFTATTIVAAGKRVTATQGTFAGVAPVTLLPAAPSTLTLQPATSVISAGQRITYTAIATDTFGNALGDVTSHTTFSIVPASGGSFVANVVTPTIKNTWIITGVDGSAVDTSLVTVTPAAFTRLAIENAPAGSGSPVNAVTLNIANTLTVYAAAYDAFNNLIGSQSVTWAGTGVAAGRVAPPTGTSTTFTPVVSGTATITATSNGITDTTGVITVQAPVLLISKTASPNPLTPGSTLQYTILYTNTGNGAAQNVVITETYPLSTAFFSAVTMPDSGTNNVWSIGPLAPNNAGSIAVFLTTANQMPVGSVLTNTVRMSSAKVASTAYTLTTPVNALPDLSASILENPDPVRPGDLLNYTIQYRNDGTAFVTNVRMTDTYPSQVSFVSANPPPINGTNNVWQTSKLNGNGDSRTIAVTVRVKSPLSDATILNNQVVVSAQEAPPYTTTEQTLVVAPDLHLSKSASSLTPAANSPLTYTLFYTNSGSSYASNTIITDALPAKTSFMSCQPDGCGLNGGIVTWNLNQLDQQTSGVVTLTVQIANNLPNRTIITNTARITSTDLVAAFTALTSTVTSAPDVTLSKSDGITSIAAGQTTTYTLSYANIGTAPASNVVITDRIPNNVAFVGCSACVAVGGGVYSFTLGTLNAAQSGAVTLSTRVASTLPAGLRAITNTAAITTSTPGGSPNNNLSRDVDTISTHPVLNLSVDYDGRTPYPGKVITYTLHYSNTSAMATTGVVITTTRPAWLGSTPPRWTRIGATDVFTVGGMAAGQSGTITYVLALPLNYTLSMNAFISTFMIQDNGPGGLPAAQAQSTTFIGVPDLSIAQVIVPLGVLPVKEFTATVVISNGGLGWACNPAKPPNNCGPFYLDVFVDPASPPPSYPFITPGDYYTSVPPIGPGLTASVVITNISFTAKQQPELYFKVDNYECSGAVCLPIGSKGGLVPEYNEFNNVAGPISVSRVTLYLPLIKKN